MQLAEAAGVGKTNGGSLREHSSVDTS